ncbi:hypothetical protein [Polaribacter cellanae]|uniref:Uncharacterized protein n=1 Tax=Polaribacter cellanae TaxID=2818493 RepID=A0A975CQM2_9FLAO|nr:hypothetical protein [Polaribacter cellanae]QTE23049.1 hypothetical protein J3359_01890 [Polaribacter cellanae]
MYEKSFDIKRIEGKFGLRRFMMYFNLFDNDFINSIQLVKNFSYFIDGLLRDPDMGGYYESLNKNPDNSIMDLTSKVHFTNKNKIANTFFQEKYFKKIIQICKENNANLTIVSMPVHSNYKKKINPFYFNYLENLTKPNKHYKYLNFLDENTNVYHLSDANHLNKVGAIKYATLINNAVNNIIKK